MVREALFIDESGVFDPLQSIVAAASRDRLLTNLTYALLVFPQVVVPPCVVGHKL